MRSGAMVKTLTFDLLAIVAAVACIGAVVVGAF
jgi:hypothetical protein